MAESDHVGAEPVFIAGCGRSGTSYLKSLLDGHPDLFIPTESLFLADYLRWGDALPKNFGSMLFFHEPQLRCWYDGPNFPIDNFAAAIRMVHERAASRNGARRWGQKTPRFIRHFTLFNAAFPGAKWVLVYRDPRAVAASMLKSKRHTYSVRRAISRWRADNALISELLRDGQTDSKALLVKYEALVTDGEKIIERIQRFVGIEPLSLQVLVANGRVEVQGRSGFENNAVRGGLIPDPKRLEAWRKVLTAADIAEVEAACGAEMDLLGYQPISSAPKRIRGVDVRRLIDIRIVFEYLRFWPSYLVYTVLRRSLLRTFAFFRGRH